MIIVSLKTTTVFHEKTMRLTQQLLFREKLNFSNIREAMIITISRFTLVPWSSSTALCPLYDPMYLYGPSSLLRNLCPSTALYPFYGPMPPPRPPTSSLGLCLLYGPLSFLRPSVLSSTLCPVRYTRGDLPLHPPIRRIFSFNQNK
jgi:hypothetical protein